MRCSEIIEQAKKLLQRQGRITCRALKQEFALDDEALSDLRDELIDAAQAAIDEGGKVLVWGGAASVPSSESQVPSSTQHPMPSTPAEAEAEACYVKTMEIAYKQQAQSLELRAATSLARLWQQQGKKDEAHEMLAEVYGGFTEGFDAKGLREAKALLDEL
ncbi:MAG TPA: hypothetical protein VNN62_23010 [Methylomirabilota bacterium]|jgi:hypothetical protein|nr:hypothetical protein [Methylomirabilota bacterium]